MMLAINRNKMNEAYTRLGIVSSSNPQDSTIKVLLQPDNVEAGPMPFCTPWIGWYAPPNAGDQCLVIFQEGNKGVPIGALLLYWDQAQPPSGVKLGEAILHHSSGSFVKLSNDGKVTLNGNVEIDITAPKVVITTTGDADINAGGNTNITATDNVNITATGNVTVMSSENVSVQASTAITVNAPAITLSDGGPTQFVMLADGNPATVVKAQ